MPYPEKQLNKLLGTNSLIYFQNLLDASEVGPALDQVEANVCLARIYRGDYAAHLRLSTEAPEKMETKIPNYPLALQYFLKALDLNKYHVEATHGVIALLCELVLEADVEVRRNHLRELQKRVAKALNNVIDVNNVFFLEECQFLHSVISRIDMEKNDFSGGAFVNVIQEIKRYLESRALKIYFHRVVSDENKIDFKNSNKLIVRLWRLFSLSPNPFEDARFKTHLSFILKVLTSEQLIKALRECGSGQRELFNFQAFIILFDLQSSNNEGEQKKRAFTLMQSCVEPYSLQQKLEFLQIFIELSHLFVAANNKLQVECWSMVFNLTQPAELEQLAQKLKEKDQKSGLEFVKGVVGCVQDLPRSRTYRLDVLDRFLRIFPADNFIKAKRNEIAKGHPWAVNIPQTLVETGRIIPQTCSAEALQGSLKQLCTSILRASNEELIGYLQKLKSQLEIALKTIVGVENIFFLQQCERLLAPLKPLKLLSGEIIDSSIQTKIINEVKGYLAASEIKFYLDKIHKDLHYSTPYHEVCSHLLQCFILSDNPFEDKIFQVCLEISLKVFAVDRLIKLTKTWFINFDQQVFRFRTFLALRDLREIFKNANPEMSKTYCWLLKSKNNLVSKHKVNLLRGYIEVNHFFVNSTKDMQIKYWNVMVNMTTSDELVQLAQGYKESHKEKMGLAFVNGVALCVGSKLQASYSVIYRLDILDKLIAIFPSAIALNERDNLRALKTINKPAAVITHHAGKGQNGKSTEKPDHSSHVVEKPTVRKAVPSRTFASMLEPRP